MNGIFNILKPSGMSSNAVLTKIKKRFNIKKVGHLGTLDPAGTGVLPVTVGKGTRLFDYFLKKDKVYKAVFTFGRTTDTIDSEGKIINSGGSIPTIEEIEKVLEKLVGTISQIPPNFSAKNINGKRAYDLARAGEVFTLPPKQVNIYNLKLLERVNETSFLFQVECSSGTYVRSICRDLATLLNTYAYMSCIIRTRSGIFKIENSITIRELLENNSENKIIGFEEILKDFEKIVLSDDYYETLVTGKKFKPELNNKQEKFLLYCKNELFGIAHLEEGFLKIGTYLRA